MDSWEFVQSSSFKVWSAIRMESTYKVKDNLEIDLCMRARMLGYFSDVFMTFKSFSDVLTFLSDEYRIDSINNTGVYLKNKYSIVLMVNWSAVVRTYQENARFSVGTAWHMKMWDQLWFENINDKVLCYTLYRCTP